MKLTGNGFTRGLVSAAVLALSTGAFAAPVVLQNAYIKVGVNDIGTLGSGDSTPPGILFDSTGTSNYGNNDFLTPGTPFEGFYVNSDQFSYGANNTSLSTDFTTTSFTSNATTAQWFGSAAGLGVSNLYSLTLNASGRAAIAITTTLTNTGASALSNLAFLRTLDPDPDVNVYNDYNTVNKLASATQACATGSKTGQTICVRSTSASATSRAGISSPWSTSPYAYLGGLNDGNGDYAIGIAFSIGTLGAGQSVTLDYEYAAGASSSIVVNPPNGVPEPGSFALVLASLAGLVAARRFKRA